MIEGNEILDNTGYGLSINGGSQNMIWNNTFYHNNGAGDVYDPSHVQAHESGTIGNSSNFWNSTDRGNYWSDWTGPDVIPPFGIVDLPYNISGSVNAKDYYPLTTPQTPIPEFQSMLLVMGVIALVLVYVVRFERKGT